MTPFIISAEKMEKTTKQRCLILNMPLGKYDVFNILKYFYLINWFTSFLRIGKNSICSICFPIIKHSIP